MSEEATERTTLRERLSAAGSSLKKLIPGSGREQIPKISRRKRVPTILQMEAVECGAACLAMILARHGRLVPLEELRVACGVSRDGSKASNVLKAARKIGMNAKGYRKEPKDLKDLSMPAIVHWNFNHFVVLEGFAKDKAYLNDPARGPTVVSEEEFDQSFTGVVMIFEPGPDFETGGERRSLTRALAGRLSGSRLGLVFVILAGLALMVPGILAPTYRKIFVDDVLVRGLVSWVRPLLVVMGITAVVQMFLTWLRQHYLLRLETKLTLKTSSAFLWHVIKLPYEFFTQRYAGEISNRVGINDKVANLLSGELATAFLNLIVIAFYAALMLQYDVVLTAVSVVIAGLNFAALRYVSRRRTDLHRRLIKDGGNMMGVAMGGLQTIETLKATGSESDFFARWSGHQAKVANSGQHLNLTTQLLSTVPPTLLALNTALILGVGGMRVIDGYLSMGMLMAFQSLTLAFINPVNRMVTIGGTLQEVEGDMNRLDDVLLAKVDPVLQETGGDGPLATSNGGEHDEHSIVKLAGYLELRNISFGYSRLEAPLISEFSLSLTPGSRVALVGGSGSGKSTVARLVAGLYEPWEGEILFDGKRREEWPREVITNTLAMVDQDIFLFEDTIRENLALWDSTLQDIDILRASRDAELHDEVTARSNGYTSLVEEGGRNFSGGQRQRMEIARALVRNPSLLILDEATSALDPTTEKIIDDNLRRRGVTCLLVAHRLSTIRDCDEIIVMDAGKIVQRGRHDELISVPGRYSDLIAAE